MTGTACTFEHAEGYVVTATDGNGQVHLFCIAGGVNDPSLWYRDRDGDGFGINELNVSAPVAIPGYVPQDGDCDDLDPSTHPGATELHNGKDDDCDGEPEPIGPDVGECSAGENGVQPTPEELGDGRDNDCDGEIDEGSLLINEVDANQPGQDHDEFIEIINNGGQVRLTGVFLQLRDAEGETFQQSLGDSVLNGGAIHLVGFDSSVAVAGAFVAAPGDVITLMVGDASTPSTARVLDTVTFGSDGAPVDDGLAEDESVARCPDSGLFRRMPGTPGVPNQECV